MRLIYYYYILMILFSRPFLKLKCLYKCIILKSNITLSLPSSPPFLFLLIVELVIVLSRCRLTTSPAQMCCSGRSPVPHNDSALCSKKPGRHAAIHGHWVMWAARASSWQTRRLWPWGIAGGHGRGKGLSVIFLLCRGLSFRVPGSKTTQTP